MEVPVSSKKRPEINKISSRARLGQTSHIVSYAGSIGIKRYQIQDKKRQIQVLILPFRIG